MADVDIRVLFRDAEAQSEIKRLQNSLRELQAEQARVRGTTFDAFSRAQIQPQVEALNSLAASVRKTIAETQVLGATIGGTEQNLSGFINSLVGADRQIKSAQSSARVLAAGIGALAEEDNRARDAAIAAQAAQAAASAATRQRAADSVAAAAAERERIAATLAADTASFIGYGRSAGARAQPRGRSATEDVDALAQQLLNLQAIAAATKMSPEFAEAAKKQVDELHQKIESLIAGGAQGSSAALQTVLKQQADAAKAAYYEKDIAASAQLYASIKAEEQAAKAAAAALKETGRAGADAADSISAKLGQSTRHIIALGDEAMRGQRGAMGASAMALLRDSGALQTAIGALSGSWGVFAVAGVAALVAVGYAAEQAYQRFASLRETTGALALQGFGGVEARAESAARFTEVQSATDEYAGTARKLVAELNNLPPAAQSSWRELAQIATAVGALKREDPAKILEELVKAAQRGPAALAEVITKLYGLQSQLGPTGQSLLTVARNATNTEEAIKKIATAGASQELTKVGNEAAKAANSFWTSVAGIAALGEGAGVANPGMEMLVNNLQKAVDPTAELANESRRLSGAIMAENDAIELGSQALDKRTKMLQQMLDAERGAARLASEVGEFGDPTAAQRAGAAARELQARQAGAPLGAAAEEEHKRELARIQERAQARHADLEAQAQAARDRAAETLRMETQRYSGPGVSPERASALASETAAVQEANNAVAAAEQRVADQRVSINRIRLEAQIADEHVGTQARIDAMNQIIAMDRKEVEEGRKAPTAVAQDEVRLANLKTQLRNRNFQEARDNARAEVELAKGNVDQILAAYAKLRGVALATGQPGAVQAQISREMVRDLESAQSQAFAKVSEYNSSVERQDNLRIGAFRAGLAVQVAQHSLSKDQMAAKEAQFTAQVMAEEEKRVEAELQGDNLTEQQKIRLYDHLAELYQKDAEKQQQAQEKLTQAIEAENQKRLQSFTSMFNSVGSALEKLGESAFFRTQTRADAFRQFGRSIGQSLLEEVGHLGSQFAGKQLAGALGVKTEGLTDTSIGSILSRALGDKLGLTKESTGQEALKGVADKWDKAVAAQNEASKLQQTAGQELQKAAQALQQVGAVRGVPTGYGKGTAMGVAGAEALPDSPSSQASAAVSYAMEHTGEKLKNYCAILVNESLEKAGVRGSGSGLASSFKSYGTPVAPGDVQKGDVFYAPPSGWGDTGHVGFTTGPVEDGRVPVFSSHMQGPASNPAGSEYRDISNLTFRRPDYSTQIAQAVRDGTESGNANLLTANDNLATGNQDLSAKISSDGQATDAQKQATAQNTQAVQQLTQKQTSTGSGSGASVGDAAKSTTSSLSLLTQGIGVAASAAALFGNHLSSAARTILGAVGVVTQLTSFAKSLGSTFDLFGTATKAASTTTTALQVANTGNTLATTLNTTATYSNSAAQSSAAAGSGIGSVLKAIPLVGMLFERGGIVPSAAGGMISPGGLSILHPREMVLPAHLSVGLQNMIERGRGANDNIGSPVLNYNANVTGYHPYSSKEAFSSMLRQHGNALMAHAENAMRNGWRG